jgi:hypothetical protein
LKIKLKGRHFDTTEVIEAESQAMLNITEHDGQDTFKKLQKSWEQCVCAEGDYFEGGDDQVSFGRDGCTSPREYGWLFAIQLSLMKYKNAH